MFATVFVSSALPYLLPAMLAAKVAENEARYRDIDVAYTAEYRLAGNRKGGELRSLSGELVGRITLAEDTTTRVVLQGAKYSVTGRQRSSTGEPEPRTRSYGYAFDGDKVRTREGNQTAIRDSSFPVPREALFPHLWATGPQFETFPLSTFLAGGAAWEKVPGRHPGFASTTLTARVVSTDIVLAGEPCVVVRCELARSGRRSSVDVHWLATSKNFIPVKTEKFALSYSETLPIEVVECGDWRELKPGVWLPFRVTKTVYDEIELRDGKKAVVSNVTKTTVSRAAVGPKFDRAFFRDVPPAN